MCHHFGLPHGLWAGMSRAVAQCQADAWGVQATRRSMTLVGIPQQQQDAVFRIVAAVLHLGNLSFEEATDIETSTIQVTQRASYHAMYPERLICTRCVIWRHILRICSWSTQSCIATQQTPRSGCVRVVKVLQCLRIVPSSHHM